MTKTIKTAVAMAAVGALVGACGIYVGPGYQTGGSNSGDRRQMMPTGIVRYSPTTLGSGTELSTDGFPGRLKITFTLPGMPLPKSVAVEYFTTSIYNSSSSETEVRSLDCKKTAEDLPAGKREFTCSLWRKHDSYDYSTFYMQSLKFDCDGGSGRFEFQQSCSSGRCEAPYTQSVYLDNTFVPTLEPMEPDQVH